jgi:Na+-translocating ferredoxin:NAD+ oxidoreductase subunit B
MQDDRYEVLRQHYNEGALSKLRKTRELIEILKIIFPPDRVAYAIALPIVGMGAIHAEGLAEKMQKDVEEVRESLKKMACDGTVMATTSKKDGKEYFALWPLIPGILENVFADGIDNDERRRLSRLIEKYYPEGLWPEFASSNYPQGRIIPINKTVEATSGVLPFEEINRKIEEADVITVIPCLCRSLAKKCDHLLETCIIFGGWADYLIKYRGARPFTKEEALERLIQCEEDGLVHLSGNAQKGNNFAICNCCSCCCKTLRGLIELHNPRSLVKSNFLPKIDVEKCNRCGKCKKICPLEAISKLPGYETDGSDTRMFVEESQCIGCGLCASHCPEEAVRMEKVRDYVPVKYLSQMVQRFVEEKILPEK